MVGLVEPAVLRDHLYRSADRPRVVNVWATWCGPCLEEMPRLAAWARARPDVEVILVNVDPPLLQGVKVAPTIRRLGVQDLLNVQLLTPHPSVGLPQVLPGARSTLPVTVVIGADGAIVRRIDRALTDADVEELLPR